MPLQHVCQIRFIEISLCQQLLDASLVLGSSHTGRNGNDVFGAKNHGRHAFVINPLGGAHGFFGQTAGGKKLNGKSAQEQVFALDLRVRFLGKHTLFNFWLGWLMRWLINPDFEKVALGAYGWFYYRGKAAGLRARLEELKAKGAKV